MAKQNPHITGCRVERPATPAEQRGEIIRDFVTGRGDQVRPMATRNPPPRYNLIGIAASIALIVGSILAAVWLVLN